MNTVPRRSFAAIVLAVSIPMFMVALDNLVVTNALASIRRDLDVSLQGLQWITNAYILGFAGMLLASAGLGDRFGRRRVFLIGIVAFTLTSIGCGLSGSAASLIFFRALQGISASAVMPISLTLLTLAVAPQKRSAAIGIWSGISGLAVAVAPLIGGAVTSGLGWHWIFLLNVPVGILAVPLVLRAVDESRGQAAPLDILGVLLASAAVLSLVWSIISVNDRGWDSGWVIGGFMAAAAFFALFVLWERRAAAPLLPLALYRVRPFTLSNLVSLAIFFGMFGPIFLITQYLQIVRGYSAWEAGLWTLPWTFMTMVVAPFAGRLTPRLGGGRLMAAGLFISAVGLAWFTAVLGTEQPAWYVVGPFLLAGGGMGLVFAPTAVVVMSSVPPQFAGKASGANTTVREVGGALGIAVCASIFLAQGSYATAQTFINGMRPGIWVGVVVLVLGALVALAIPRLRFPAAPQPEAAPESAVAAK